MKKSSIIYLAALLAAASCTEANNTLFDQSAAERLEQGKKDYLAALTAEGGLWEMEYFSNYTEPGYVMLFKFEADKSVTISADHMWIGNQFKQEKSLWDISSDNGNVLTFNSYNTLFHIFSDPQNILGANAPTDPTTGADINEDGYGHNGDYEFMLMENTGDTIRLVGKKRGLTAMLHRLPADTDPEAYLASVSALRRQFSAAFPRMTLTEPSGLTYVVTNMSYGVPVVVPTASTSPASRTVSGNAIITLEGMRFMDPLEIVREDNSTFTVHKFAWAADGALVTADSIRLAAPEPGMHLSSGEYLWTLDKESMSPALLAAHDAASAALQASAGTRFDLRKIQLGYYAYQGTPMFSLTLFAGSRRCRDYGTLETTPDGKEVSIAWTASDRASSDFDKTVPEFTALKQLFAGHFAVGNASAMNPGRINFVSTANPEISFSFDVD